MLHSLFAFFTAGTKNNSTVLIKYVLFVMTTQMYLTNNFIDQLRITRSNKDLVIKLRKISLYCTQSLGTL
jgi:hypothetical protein